MAFALWKGGRLEEGKIGRREDWKGGRLEAFHVPCKTLKAVLDLED
jgi:hypothetical protein